MIFIISPNPTSPTSLKSLIMLIFTAAIGLPDFQSKRKRQILVQVGCLQTANFVARTKQSYNLNAEFSLPVASACPAFFVTP